MDAKNTFRILLLAGIITYAIVIFFPAYFEKVSVHGIKENGQEAEDKVTFNFFVFTFIILAISKERFSC